MAVVIGSGACDRGRSHAVGWLTVFITYRYTLERFTRSDLQKGYPVYIFHT